MIRIIYVHKKIVNFSVHGICTVYAQLFGLWYSSVSGDLRAFVHGTCTPI